MSFLRITNATLILPDRLLPEAGLDVRNGRIAAVGPVSGLPGWDGPVLDAGGAFLSPGFVDMHVHGGDGSDFMDGTEADFARAADAHLRHGTTGLIATSTVATHEQTLAFLKLCRQFKEKGRALGAHLYGPYFAEDKVGCHPKVPARPPTKAEYGEYLRFADTILVATCAPELEGSAAFYRDAAAAGIRLNAGHSNCTWTEMERAYALGVRHVDHFYCAMSSVVSLRARFGTPMQASMMEFVLATPDMSTEIIADGRHLAPELLRFVLKMKGVDRTALVTDCNRALDMPVGDYVFGPRDGGTDFHHDGEVGLTPDRTSLASSTRGMDFMVRHMHAAAGVDLPTAVRMASLTPAKIVGLDREVGSLEAGKRADLLLLDRSLSVSRVWLAGREAWAK